jgi:glycosyltransferase involved in cell wall biosynthesis
LDKNIKKTETTKRLPIIIIPAYNPGDDLVEFVEKLLQEGYPNILVVDDGSKEECADIFTKVKNFKRVVFLKNAVNLGKGGALKLAFNHVLVNFSESTGVITVDADGQHLPKDIKAVSEKLINNEKTLVLGVRSFSKDIPFRSYFGNQMTKYIFGFLIGKLILDTQTGLRGIPLEFLKVLMPIKSNRYEFELEMLIHACRYQHYHIEQIPIETVYLNDNESSHFNPLIDSLKIYFVFLRFIASSLCASIIDFICYAILIFFTNSLILSLSVARIISLTSQFMFNKKLVFCSSTDKKKTRAEIIKFFLLAIFLYCSSYIGIELVHTYFKLNFYISKILVELSLFVISFLVQDILIFRASKKKKN